jgi:acyl-homoserine-lactone acylase
MTQRPLHIAASLLLGFLLIACGEEPRSPTPADNSRNALDWAGTYSGVLPCASCPGIETTITLSNDGTFERSLHYIDENPLPVRDSGTFSWNEGGNAITLSPQDGDPQRYQVGEHRLFHLDADGERMRGELEGHYVLEQHRRDPAIEDRHWRLVELNGQPVTRSEQRREAFFQLRSEAGRMSGNTSCNSFNGAYAIKGGQRISFAENIATTLMACPDMDGERAFIEMLKAVDNYSLDQDGRLSLNRARMAPLARFVEKTEELSRLEARAERVEILRDDWGIPHIYAQTDADAVFGLMYAQAEDDFYRIEMNYLSALGRRAEADGAGSLWQDLRMQLFIDPAALQALYADSPDWLRQLMDAWADGLNYYLATHPETRAQVLTHFEPWMALAFSEGSIGGDIERVELAALKAFYTGVAAEPRPAPDRAPAPDTEPRGSNGIAIAPENTEDGNALLLINPHTSFFFRHEAHVVSEEGLNAYGALTWGQFFVYQGFNETAGWMHTSSTVDNIDEFAEEIVEREDGLFYRYGDDLRPVSEREIAIRVREADGSLSERHFTAYRTHHGPIVRAEDGRWIATALMERPLQALAQSYSRTKAANLDAYLEVMKSHTNSSNNTVFADAEGNIAYLHSNFVPVRDARFDYTAPVNGADPATDWQGVHSLEESPNAINPATGFAFCSNNWPYSAAGSASPAPGNYPAYMDRGRENYRGEHALRLLPGRDDFTLERLVDVAYSTQLPYFDSALPPLFSAFEAMPEGPDKTRLAPAVAMLRAWDRRWSTESAATSLGVYFARERQQSADAPLDALAAAVRALQADFGSIETPWGEINRFQRLTGDIEQTFRDEAASTAVGFPSARLGTLASFGARQYPGTKRWYGTSGNSFVAVVEFGGPGKLRARAVTAGGLNSAPESPHFNDQAERYATGDLREVYFYRADVEAAATRRYRPGQ